MGQLPRWNFRVALVVAGLAGGLAAARAQAPDANQPAPAAQVAFFETQVRPILKASCLSCHGPTSPSGGLSLSSRSTLLAGGNSGPAVTFAKPTESLLVKAIQYQGRQMPPTGKLPQAKIDVLTRWVQMGLPWTPGEKASIKPPTHIIPPPVNAQTMRFWSFQPVKHRIVPAVRHPQWVKNPIDAFVLSRLEAAKLTPMAPAAKTTLLRRATYDLIGLPPNPKEIQAFLADKSPNAYEKVVDRLLASPHYGERWGRHWLDLVRYAETNSFERDDAKPFVWRYRDYVIRSLNADKPYDQFVREQLAGDELPQVTADSMTATGYYRLGTWDDEPSDPEQARYDELDDIVATTGQVFLGLTVNCARCHDHKLDPIPQKDYYRMLSFFQGVTRFGGGGSVADNSIRSIGSPEEHIRFEALDAAYKQKLEPLMSRRTALEAMVLPHFSNVDKEEFTHEDRRRELVKKYVPGAVTDVQAQEYVRLCDQIDALKKNPPPGLAQALCVSERGAVPPPTSVLMRGNPHIPGDKVEPAFLSVLAPPKPVLPDLGPNAKSSGRRLALANWIASSHNPMTARVMVNRIWQYHFGRGIVRSSSNFGSLGNRPTHPELLDWLAENFVRGGWKLKSMHRLILLSNTYRMSSQGNVKALAKDPENDLLWRFDMRRLDAEEIRDSILAVNDSLNLKQIGGQSIFPTMPEEVLAGESMPGRGWTASSPEEQARRSVYIHIKRSLALPILASFDAADTDFSCPVRFATTQPTQALGMLNSPFLNEQARVFADDVWKQAGPDPAAEVKIVLARVFQREPMAKEVARGLRFIKALEIAKKVDRQEALRCFCVVALNLDEFVYLD